MIIIKRITNETILNELAKKLNRSQKEIKEDVDRYYVILNDNEIVGYFKINWSDNLVKEFGTFKDGIRRICLDGMLLFLRFLKTDIIVKKETITNDEANHISKTFKMYDYRDIIHIYFY